MEWPQHNLALDITPDTMVQIKLDDCALQYANIWTLKEAPLVFALAEVDANTRREALCRAGGYFKIARSFQVAYDVDRGIPRFQPVLDALDRIPVESVTDATLRKVVGRFRRELGRPYGNRDLLSAATKFLWLRHRDVVVIHDSQARLALNAPYGDYGDYLERWHSEYDIQRPAITNACERLEQKPKRVAADVRREIAAHASSDWFARRVFDIYLWNKGAPVRSP